MWTRLASRSCSDEAAGAGGLGEVRPDDGGGVAAMIAGAPAELSPLAVIAEGLQVVAVTWFAFSVSVQRWPDQDGDRPLPVHVEDTLAALGDLS
jgi:hypothetical protein